MPVPVERLGELPVPNSTQNLAAAAVAVDQHKPVLDVVHYLLHQYEELGLHIEPEDHLE